MKSYHYLWLSALLLLAAGLFRQEYRDIFLNAVFTCLSCIGVG